MADITVLDGGAFGQIGSRQHAVASGAAATIKAGRLVLKSLGSASVVAWDVSNTAKPVVATDFLAGLAMTDSTDTASAAGTVQIQAITPGVVYLGNPDTAATWNTQAKYDALVGDRVLVSTTSAGVQTILASDSATSGLVVEPLDISKYPVKVAFSLRQALSYTA